MNDHEYFFNEGKNQLEQGKEDLRKILSGEVNDRHGGSIQYLQTEAVARIIVSDALLNIALRMKEDGR